MTAFFLNMIFQKQLKFIIMSSINEPMLRFISESEREMLTIKWLYIHQHLINQPLCFGSTAQDECEPNKLEQKIERKIIVPEQFVCYMSILLEVALEEHGMAGCATSHTHTHSPTIRYILLVGRLIQQFSSEISENIA